MEKSNNKQQQIQFSTNVPLPQLNFSQKQLENLVDGLMAVGDANHDGKISFDEYVAMSKDVFVDNFAPNVFKRVMR